MKATIRRCEATQDRAGLKSCIIELQDFERSLEPKLPRGADMADAYVEPLLKRCSGSSGRIFVALADQIVVGFVAVFAEAPTDPDEEPSPYAYISDLVPSGPPNALEVSDRNEPVQDVDCKEN